MRKGDRKLCVVLPSHWAKNFGGAEGQVRYLLDALIERCGFEIAYLARYVDTTFDPAGYKINKIKRLPGFGHYGFVFDAPALLFLLNRIRPDVIYQRVGCAYTGISAYYAKKNKCKLVWHVSSDSDVSPAMNIFKGPFRYFEKRVMEYGIREATSIIAQTHTQAEKLEKNYGRSSARVIYNFHPFPEEKIIKTTGVKVVWIANLKPNKQPEIFLNLAKNKTEAEFIMIGRCDRNGIYGSFLRGVEATGAVDYLGERSQEEVNKILSSAEILVNTSLEEGFSNTFIQAWMRQVPVVSLNVDPDGLLEKNRIGYCSGTYQKLRDNVLELIENDLVRKEMGMRAQKYAFEKHSLSNIEDVIRILEQ